MAKITHKNERNVNKKKLEEGKPQWREILYITGSVSTVFDRKEFSWSLPLL